MKRIVENFREFLDLASINQGPNGWSIYGSNPSENDNYEMIEGVIEIINKVKDIDNRKSIAIDMLGKFKQEGVKVNRSSFMKACGLDSNSLHRRLQKK
jgi:hypothetical protein